MADVKLGPTGSEVMLPILQFMGSPPELPVTIEKKIDKAEMLDGSYIWAFFPASKKRVWTIAYPYLSKAEMDTIEGLYNLDQILRFQNEHEDSTWYDVVFTSWRHKPVRTDIRSLGRYYCEFTLEEA